MSNFRNELDSDGDLTTVYTEPKGASFYRAEIVLSPEYRGDRVGLCMTVHGDGENIVLGLNDAEDVHEFVYALAVRSKMISDGEPLILLKPVAVEEDAA